MESTTYVVSSLITYLKSALAPRISRHGVLVEVYGEGLLLMGESGIGKSEAAIELVKRGHRLIADDAVEMAELQSIDTSSISFGLVGDIYAGQWLVVGLDWKSLQPLYNFTCGSNGKYIVPEEETSDDNK